MSKIPPPPYPRLPRYRIDDNTGWRVATDADLIMMGDDPADYIPKKAEPKPVKEYRIIVYPGACYVQQRHHFLFWSWWSYLSYLVGSEMMIAIRKRFASLEAAQQYIDRQLELEAAANVPPLIVPYPPPASAAPATV